MKYQEAIDLVNNQLRTLNSLFRYVQFAPSVNDHGFGISGSFDEWAVKREKNNIVNGTGIYKIEFRVLKWRKGAKGVIGDPLWELVFKGNFEQVVGFLYKEEGE
tara:strand:- start:396 stop:707 length:312 start_codon:yes stop_codon:yes gene_type:complete